jgi:predicted dinucleotide-binding enzyme
MRIAIIGAGSVGTALAGTWTKSSHQVTFGVRDPASPKVKEAINAIGGKTTATTNALAASAAEVILLATPWDATRTAIESCGPLANKIVIDATNPLRMGPAGLELALGRDTSGAEQVAGWAKGASVFKAFNQTGAPNMDNSDYGDHKPVMFVAGDDAAKKPTVLTLVKDAGFEAADAGPLAAARLLEPLAMLWIHLALNQKWGTGFAWAVVRR